MSRSSEAPEPVRVRLHRALLVHAVLIPVVRIPVVLIPVVLVLVSGVLWTATVAAADPPVFADGPIPGQPVAIPPGTTFVVLDMQLGVADRRGIARVESTPSQTEVHLNSTILFAEDSAAIRPAAAARLIEVARQLQTLGPGTLAVTGYTDDLGSAAHGVDLSRRRAAAVALRLRSVLPATGFSLTVRGRGEADPEVPNDSAAHRRINRRVIIDYRPR